MRCFPSLSLLVPFLVSALLLARPSRADETPLPAVTAEPVPPVTDPRPFRISLAGTLGLGPLARSTNDPTTEQAGSDLGVELRLQPYGTHGVVIAYTNAQGILGPIANIIDVAYSFPLITRPTIHGVTGAAFLDIGPAVALLHDSPPESDHTVVGGRVSLTADLHIYNFLLGVVGAYRGGIPIGVANDPWESDFSISARLGVVFDVKDPSVR